MSISVKELHRYLQLELAFENFSDIDTINGIQVSRNSDAIDSIAFAVDSSLPTIEKAVELSVNMLMVHHGIFWGRVEAIDGSLYAKLSKLVHNDIMLYAIHLPLDANMKYGNNIQLAKVLGLQCIEAYGNYKGRTIGVSGEYDTAIHRDDCVNILFSSEHTKSQDDAYYLSYYSLPFISVGENKGYRERAYASFHRPLGIAFHGPEQIKKVAIVSGGVPSNAILEAKQNNIDLYICGDASHTIWLEAQQLGINVLFAGHYFTETWGIMSLGQHLSTQFSLKGVFIHAATQH